MIGIIKDAAAAIAAPSTCHSLEFSAVPIIDLNVSRASSFAESVSSFRRRHQVEAISKGRLLKYHVASQINCIVTAEGKYLIS